MNDPDLNKAIESYRAGLLPPVAVIWCYVRYRQQACLPPPRADDMAELLGISNGHARRLISFCVGVPRPECSTKFAPGAQSEVRAWRAETSLETRAQRAKTRAGRASLILKEKENKNPQENTSGIRGAEMCVPPGEIRESTRPQATTGQPAARTDQGWRAVREYVDAHCRAELERRWPDDWTSTLRRVWNRQVTQHPEASPDQLAAAVCLLAWQTATAPLEGSRAPKSGGGWLVHRAPELVQTVLDGDQLWPVEARRSIAPPPPPAGYSNLCQAPPIPMPTPPPSSEPLPESDPIPESILRLIEPVQRAKERERRIQEERYAAAWAWLGGLERDHDTSGPGPRPAGYSSGQAIRRLKARASGEIGPKEITEAEQARVEQRRAALLEPLQNRRLAAT